MAFEQHAFISYAHLDNEPLIAGGKGWVSQFDAALRVLLSQRLGEKVKMWRDEKLAGNDVFANEITELFGQTALLVTVLSPRYLKSEWCGRELAGFLDAASHSGGVAIGNNSRVIKVVKTPLEEPAPPLVASVLQQTLGFEFYRADTEPAEEIDPAFGEEVRAEFLRRISRLAVAMADSLREIVRQSRDAPGAAPRPAVYLAECGRDLVPVREQLAADLRSHGYEVLPAQALPSTEDELRAALAEMLPRCAWSIHLVGNSTGLVPDGPSGRSLVDLQNEVAATEAAAGGLRRLIWLPDGATGERPAQQQFIATLLSSASLQQGADLLRGNAESLKVAMHQALAQAATPAPAPPAATAAGPARLHLLMTEADRAAAVPLIKRLRARGFEVTLPLFTGDAAALRAGNTQLAAEADVLVLFYGAGDETWKYYQRNDLRKHVEVVPRERPAAVWTALAAPLTPDKALLSDLAEPGTLDLLQGLDAVPDDALPAP